MIPILLRVTVSRNTFVKSTVNLGPFSIIIGWVSVCWLFMTSCFFLFPNQFNEDLQQTATIFNYTCAVVGLVLIVASIYWFLPKSCGGARHFFTGPKRTNNDINDADEIQKIELQRDPTLRENGVKLDNPTDTIKVMINH